MSAGLVLQVADDGFRDGGRVPRNAGEHEHQMTLQRFEALAGKHHRAHGVGAALRHGDVVEAAESRRYLILQPHALVQHALFDVDGLAGQRFLGDVSSLERVHGVDQSHGKGRAGSEPGPRREIPVVVNLEAFRDVEPAQHAADRRVLNLADVPDVLDDGIDDAELVIEEGRQLAHAEVAVLVDGGRQHGAPVLAEPFGIVSSTAKERNPEWCAADDHDWRTLRIIIQQTLIQESGRGGISGSGRPAAGSASSRGT